MTPQELIKKHLVRYMMVWEQAPTPYDLWEEIKVEADRIGDRFNVLLTQYMNLRNELKTTENPEPIAKKMENLQAELDEKMEEYKTHREALDLVERKEY